MKLLNKFGNLLRKRKVAKAVDIHNVAVFGYGDATPGDKLFKEVEKVTFELAKAGYVVVDGGGPGVMRAATIGAKKAGGKVIAVTLYPEDMTRFEGVDPKNDFDREIKTKSYIERTLTLMKAGQVYVVFNGGTGTISEFAMAWGLARLYFGRHKPLILYGDFWKKIIKAFETNMMIRAEELKVFKIVNSPEGVLRAIDEFEHEIKCGEGYCYIETDLGDYKI